MAGTSSARSTLKITITTISSMRVKPRSEPGVLTPGFVARCRRPDARPHAEQANEGQCEFPRGCLRICMTGSLGGKKVERVEGVEKVKMVKRVKRVTGGHGGVSRGALSTLSTSATLSTRLSTTVC